MTDADQPHPRRLTSRDHAEIEALILEDLREHGPSVFSAIHARLRHRMAETLANAGLRSLVANGRVSFTLKEFSHRRALNGVEHRYPYKAREYALVKGRKPARPQQIVPKPTSAKAVEEMQAKREARKALVLADVAANGPSRFREIVVRLVGKVNESDTRRFLNALAAEGRIRIDAQLLTDSFPQGEGRRAMQFRANVYSLEGEG